jgi:hypothetical protein
VLVRAIDRVFEILPPDREDIPERDELLDATIAVQSFVFNTFGCLDNLARLRLRPTSGIEYLVHSRWHGSAYRRIPHDGREMSRTRGVEVYPGIIKLDPSAPYFVQSRTLAWIWVYEKGITNNDGTELDLKRVGLGKSYKQVRRSFSKHFLNYLESRQAWFDHIKEFRDSLAHRIPLYIPPYVVFEDNHQEYNRLEQEMGKALKRADFVEYDRLESEQKKLGVFRPWMTHSQTEGAPSVVFHTQLLADYNTVDEFGNKMLEELGCLDQLDARS